MLPYKPIGPRSKRTTPGLVLSLSSPSTNPTVTQHNDHIAASNSPGQHNHFLTPLSPLDLPRFTAPVPKLAIPVPRMKGPELRIAKVYPIPANSPSPSDSIFTSSVTIIGSRRAQDTNMHDNGNTIRLYSPEQNQHIPRTIAPPDAEAAKQHQHQRNFDPSVNGIRNLIDKISISKNHISSTKPVADESMPELTVEREDSGDAEPGLQMNDSILRGAPDIDRVGRKTQSSPSQSPTETPAAIARKDFSDDNFNIISRLGEGAGGAVHKVIDKRDGATFARKIITTRDSSSIRQVLREITIIFGMRHKNIVSSYGVYMSPSSSEVKIVMEYCEGGSLESIGAKLREVGAVVGEKTAGRIAEGVFQGLAYLHAKRTIHRDIKPSNILLSQEGVVKLCDFGVSRELVHSNVGTFTGTLLYMAPERIAGGEYNVRSDVWSAGISLLELVQNRFPFPSDLPPMEVILMIRTAESPKLEDEPESSITWTAEMKDFIRHALIHDGAERPTPKEMLEHPWIKKMMREKVNMARWIGQVWGWKSRRGRNDTPLSTNGYRSSISGNQ